jgi:N-hydroxyarylamine O-acetyltransferase
VTDTDFDLNLYLHRIRHSLDVGPTIECLESLQRTQHHTIPFENFDIQLDRSIDLAPETLFRKLVLGSRGGYCFELNGLFLSALQKIGFKARPLLGRVHISGEATGRGHQISLVTIDNKLWIADVGFGADTPRCPLPLETDTPTSSGGQTIQIIESDKFGFMVQALREGAWRSLYSFDLEHVCRGDIEYGNYYTSTHPDSIFVMARIAVLPQEAGYLSLFDNKLTSVEAGKNESEVIEDGASYLDVLENRFGIKLDASFDSLKKVGSR